MPAPRGKWESPRSLRKADRVPAGASRFRPGLKPPRKKRRARARSIDEEVETARLRPSRIRTGRSVGSPSRKSGGGRTGVRPRNGSREGWKDCGFARGSRPSGAGIEARFETEAATERKDRGFARRFDVPAAGPTGACFGKERRERAEERKVRLLLSRSGGRRIGGLLPVRGPRRRAWEKSRARQAAKGRCVRAKVSTPTEGKEGSFGSRPTPGMVE
jgi:hypothetical protein